MYTLAGVQSDCSVSSMNVTLTLEQEFQGVLYARGFPLECRALGSLQPSVTLHLAASGCGVRITPSEVSRWQSISYLNHIAFLDNWRCVVRAYRPVCRFHTLRNSMEYNLIVGWDLNWISSKLYTMTIRLVGNKNVKLEWVVTLQYTTFISKFILYVLV